MKNQFLLNQEITYLNHGSFGACPKIVFEDYQKWQLELEKQPVEFLGRRYPQLLENVRIILGNYVGSKPENFVNVTNTTFGLNAIANSLNLKNGDEVLITNQEYGAVERMWNILAQQKGFSLVKADIQFPINSDENCTNSIKSKISENTKVLFLSQITSSTALILPIYEICKFAKERNIITIIDGAHSPGHIDLKLDESPFDFFVGNCHKWLLSPKGAAFMYAKPEVQNLLKPLIISWSSSESKYSNSPFIDEFEYIGTKDIAAFLAIPASIDFVKSEKFTEAKKIARNLIFQAKERIFSILKTPYITEINQYTGQIYAHELPENINPKLLKSRLYDEFKIEIPVTNINNKSYIRISVQVYNNQDDLNKFYDSLEKLINEF